MGHHAHQSQENRENEPSEVDIALTWCLDLINSNELRITADLLGRLQIIIPDDYEARQHPLNSSRLDAYLVDQYFLAYKRVLPNRYSFRSKENRRE
jgi:hypothetical protein